MHYLEMLIFQLEHTVCNLVSHQWIVFLSMIKGSDIRGRTSSVYKIKYVEPVF
jgi:hypothetical protein